MPLFTEAAYSAAMKACAKKLSAKAIQHLHPGQIPVITRDQPLYSIAKRIQWTWPHTFLEDKFVDILTGSRWTAILVQSEVTTSGQAEAILKGANVTRSRYIH